MHSFLHTYVWRDEWIKHNLSDWTKECIREMNRNKSSRKKAIKQVKKTLWRILRNQGVY